MLRSFLIYLSKAQWAQKMVTGWLFAWRAASRFVAGEKAEDAIRAVRELNAKGIQATLDHLGEHTSTVDEASQATQDILAILDAIDAAGVEIPYPQQVVHAAPGSTEVPLAARRRRSAEPGAAR